MRLLITGGQLDGELGQHSLVEVNQAIIRNSESTTFILYDLSAIN